MPSHRCPEPIGPDEIRRLFNVSRNRVVTLRKEADFPPPWKHLATGVVWRDTDIEAYAERKGRKLYPLD